MRYQAQVPLRIDFGGGWTDVPDFAEAEPEGGAVLNAAINVYAKGFIERPYSALLPVTPAESSHSAERAETLKRPSWFRRQIQTNRVSYQLDAPAGAGLGGSAAQTLLWLTLVKTSIANVSGREELAERAWRVERELGIVGGKQDHYCCAVGGINFMTFGDRTVVESLRLPLPLLDDLEPRLSLFFSGRSHLSGSMHEAVWDKYRSGDSGVTDALRELRRVALAQREALTAGDIIGLGRLMNANWSAQKLLDPAITNHTLDGLIETALANGAVGAKVTGAGAGGCILCLAEPGATGLADAMREAGARMIPFRFDWFGVHLTKG